MGMLLLDTVLYLLIMVYLDTVMPREWGTPKHPLFCILEPIRWCFSRGRHDDSEDQGDGRAPDGVFEEVEDEQNSAVRIAGLRKKFKHSRRSFLAVNNLYWSLREGEISVLLGHNGAGKSTTINMMTGMLQPDGGDCYVHGLSVRHQLSKVRQEIGFCPQHNILWPELTCREHLCYFAKIKGLKGARLEEAVERLLEAVDLQDKEHSRSSALSGGQKRKLSVGIAFVGESPLVFLDEPTAGMDVGARRHTWELLKRMSEFHTILLTTHYMDEADLLGHRIGIMSKGRLQCSGSSMFLKSKLGAGYLMTISVLAHADRQAMEELVRSHVESAESVGSGAGEIAFRLPMDKKDKFAGLLSDLETRGNSLGVCSYSLSVTTLEEIFIKIAEAASMQASSNGETESNTPVDAEQCVWNVNLIQREREIMRTQFSALMAKRLWNSLRDRRTQFFQIVCPVVCVLLAMLLTLIKFFDSPTLVLSNNLYGTDVQVDVANCDAVFDLSVPFSPNAETSVVPGVTSSSLSAHLLSTYHTHSLERYGAISCRDPTLGGATMIFYNTSSSHEVAIGVVNFYNGILFRANRAAKPMVTRVQTLPKTRQEEIVNASIYAMLISIVIMIPFTFIPSTFVSWVVKERQCKARHLQNVSGLRFAVYWLSNFPFHNPGSPPEAEDEDVVRERKEVMSLPERADDLVRVVNLRKVYPGGKVAVRDLTFGVKPGEVFGFLGTNGAGKTTTIAILCQEFLPTSGQASVCGHDIANDSAEALRNIGYCPQFDACLDLLTVEEHLRLYAGVRGVASTQRDDVVAGLLRICELTDYRRTLAHELSGGNRRKLSVAISLVGGPRVVFLDEPSAGMDPVARRGLWNAIEKIADNCSVVLTTHHLEEVEALAHRVAIMVDGTLRCIGDKVHLKNKYGSGYEMHLRVNDAVAPNHVESFVSQMFPGATLNEYKGQRFVYALARDTSLANAFRILQQYKDTLGITDYSVSQTSIEQVFLRISGEM
ncbi:ABC transporter-like [Trypanosoma melophagium]|uniref:ABC transporter-like n=1 Tax=Trypanosoma melophagium TaxID=715481 RepID=UPI00351A0C88|nr:ABC transporter-like [Trypanosoma melophagium]